MAAKKEHKLKESQTVITESGKLAKEAKPVGDSGKLRTGACLLWALAIAMEACGLATLLGKMNLKFMPTDYQIIAYIVLDLIFVIIGSQLWKKANHITPASEENKLKFWLWNNMGVIVCCFAFIPYIVLLLKDKDMDKKTRTVALAAAAIALIIGGASSVDYNPVSAEQQAAAINTFGDEIVYWAPYGKVYHTHEDCSALNRSDELTYGTVEQAIAENRTRLCSFCAKEDSITGVATEE